MSGTALSTPAALTEAATAADASPLQPGKILDAQLNLSASPQERFEKIAAALDDPQLNSFHFEPDSEDSMVASLEPPEPSILADQTMHLASGVEMTGSGTVHEISREDCIVNGHWMILEETDAFLNPNESIDVTNVLAMFEGTISFEGQSEVVGFTGKLTIQSGTFQIDVKNS